MSRYFSRLARSAQINHHQPSLQPFIRSQSPIADHDQRIGMTDFEDFNFDLTVSKASIPEVAENQGEIVSDLISPKITPVNQPSNPVVQRKMVDSSPNLASPPSSSVHNFNPSLSVTEQQNPSVIVNKPDDHNVPNVPDLARREDPLALESSVKSTENSNFSQQSSELPNLTDDHKFQAISLPQIPDHPSESSDSTPSLSTQLFLRSNSAEVVVNPLNVSPPIELSEPTSIPQETALETTYASDQNQSSPSTNEPPSREFNPVRLRTIGETQPVTIAHLNPSVRSLDDANQFSAVEDSSPELGEIAEPRVIIGRINIEVVAPPSENVPKTRSLSNPVTANSVSVIGPLGSQVRPSVRFNLRQR